jgi:RNA polymerase sigma factor (sigma-70 family)
MSLHPSTANGTSLVAELKVEPAWLEKATGEADSKEALWPHHRVNGHTALATTPTTNHAVILHIRPAYLADARPADGQATITEQDAADMASLCRDDDEAMTRLMRRHAPRLRCVIARMLKDWTEAADVVDEAFIRVYRHRQRFDLQARFTTWLYTIAMNLARNRLRHRARQPEIVSLEELSEDELESQQRVPAREPAPDVRLEHEEAARQLEDSFADLPPQLREPLQLFACDELSQIEIASLFHCSAKAIESRLYHARKRLRADFARILQPRPDWLSVRPFKPQHKIEIKT